MLPSTRETVQACAVRLLARRDHSRWQLQQKLSAREFPSDDITAVLDLLSSKGWQDDRRFAEVYTRSRIERGDGPLKIQAHLREYRVADAIVEGVLSQDDEFWQQNLLRKWSKKCFAKRQDLAARAKAIRFLQSRGFTFEQIKNVEKSLM
jgi:regulatory protein